MEDILKSLVDYSDKYLFIGVEFKSQRFQSYDASSKTFSSNLKVFRFIYFIF